jgi:hypothetical protein
MNYCESGYGHTGKQPMVHDAVIINQSLELFLPRTGNCRVFDSSDITSPTARLPAGLNMPSVLC